MAKKPRGFGELLKQQQTNKARQKTLKKLEQKLRQGPLGEASPEFVINPKGEVKTSTVLKAFVAPYLDRARNRNRRESLFGLAIFAWNLTLMPENEWQAMIDQMFGQVLKERDPLIEQDTREFIDELIARKQEFFADNQHYILSYQLQDTGNEYQIAVASTLMDQSAAV